MAESNFGGAIIIAIIATVIAMIFGLIGLFLNFNWLAFHRSNIGFNRCRIAK